MLDGALVTCVLLFLVCGAGSVARTAIRYHQRAPYERYLATLKRIGGFK